MTVWTWLLGGIVLTLLYFGPLWWRRQPVQVDRTRFPRDFPEAVAAVDAVLEAGEKKHGDRWRQVRAEAHFDHLWNHLLKARHRFDRIQGREPLEFLPTGTEAAEIYLDVMHATTRALMVLERWNHPTGR